MTKSNRHKKLRKQEKAKTQLTGVKKLSKAQNVVEPTLRVKKILIREQLKTSSLSATADGWKGSASRVSGDAYSDADAGETRWKQSVQELLVSSNHHNVNMRKDAISGLQEIAASNSSSIIRHLDKLLGRIAALTSDQESIIRKENLKLATSVISMISDDQLTPFWSMLIAHLKCTMTHLDISVRYSALSFIELLVDHHPSLVNESSSVLLPCLLGLISTTDLSITKDKNASKQKNVTKLKTEITGKHDDMSVRIKVLRLLSKCLKMSLSTSDEPIKTAAEHRQYENISPYLNLQYPFGYHWGISGNDSYACTSGSYTDRFYSTITADPYMSAFSDASSKGTLNQWYSFALSCITVLIETWVELSPSLGKRDDHGSKKGSGKASKQPEIGSDKDSNSNMGRRNGLHILNEISVESMLNIAVLLEQLLQTNGNYNSFMRGNSEDFSLLVKDIKRAHGQNLMKYFFGLMPYESVKDSKQKDVMAINLKLFLIAGKLKMFDNFLRKKLQLFIEGVITRSYKLDENHCKLILDVIRFVDVQNAKELPTHFLIAVSKIGFHRVIAQFLAGLIHPGRCSSEFQKDKALQDMLQGMDFKDIVLELINTWPISSKSQNEHLDILLELLTYIGLRRLTDMNSILRSCMPKLKELVSSNEQHSTLEGAHRVFVYADAEDVFQREFTQ